MSDNTLVQEENATQAEVTPNTEIEAQEESKSSRNYMIFGIAAGFFAENVVAESVI